ncbi:hypothetical protein ANME2D_02469 [Candidatus Methanoperedens nitroreducens]|uniref:Uncharacterized protein n=1 Tax=Candidatus Methanoperedens nitratireducens TaxID=1392998 RepID=A0A062V1L4_9EURY|nr:hypothetical protein ANME2D_02469 [Candidatus Methanoperedens nitroreducens]
MRVGSLARVKDTGDLGIIVEIYGDYAKLRIHPPDVRDACTLYPDDEPLGVEGK